MEKLEDHIIGKKQRSATTDLQSSLKKEGHTKWVYSVCWDPSGEFVASVSEDSVTVWTLDLGNEGECVHELSCNGNKFHSCVFHPTYTSLLVIGCYQDVLFYNFFGASFLKNHWRVVYEYMKQQDLLDGMRPRSFPRFDVAIHNVLYSELKQLYVAITRTRQGW